MIQVTWRAWRAVLGPDSVGLGGAHLHFNLDPCGAGGLGQRSMLWKSVFSDQLDSVQQAVGSSASLQLNIADVNMYCGI